MEKLRCDNEIMMGSRAVLEGRVEIVESDYEDFQWELGVAKERKRGDSLKGRVRRGRDKRNEEKERDDV